MALVPDPLERPTPTDPSAMTDAELASEIEWAYLLKEYDVE